MKKISLKQKKRLLGWFSQQPKSVLLEILEVANETFYRFRERMPGAARPAIRYEAFLDGIKSAYDLEYSTAMKNPDHDLQKVLALQEEKVKRFAEKRKERLVRKRKSKKRDLILRHLPDIQLMRAQGLSYPAITEYFKRYHISVHPSYIQQLWKEHCDGKDK
ncbi:MAG: hypothetical protein Q7J15_09095 [Candidatus Desulfaltia sp.]|nr:hypothetical protein [Candidatus Desulfaltia sp.]